MLLHRVTILYLHEGLNLNKHLVFVVTFKPKSFPLLYHRICVNGEAGT